MIYLELFVGFLTVGLFSFGGAYAAIPLIRDVVTSYGWIGEDTLTDMIAIGESTPGPIMVNLATYVGSSKAGLLGGIIATFAVILPAFIIILLIMVMLKNLQGNKYVQAILRGLQPCIIGIILATGFMMMIKNTVFPLLHNTKDYRPAFMGCVLAIAYFAPRKVFGKKLSPILLIMISAVLGVITYGV
ncbi:MULTISPECIES: chromate transporter [unclassified Butyrivibrio]|uniref:chromate transporter n=1 Tax=unclassified Butyrivibrio TaxID=2639466 RepID=UPI0004229735|nr:MULTISPECIES: chromate transporter [unclassified Butyrivibrio]